MTGNGLMEVIIPITEEYPHASPYEVTNIAFYRTYDRMKELEAALQQIRGDCDKLAFAQWLANEALDDGAFDD